MTKNVEMTVVRSFDKRETANSFGGHVGVVTLAASVGEITLDGKALPTSSVEYLLNFALQSLQDAYAGAKTLDEAKASWSKKLEAIIGGTLGQRASSGVSVETSIARQIMRKLAKDKIGAKSPAWATFTGLSDDEQDAKLDVMIEKNEAVIAPMVAAEVKRRADAKKATAGIAATIEI